MSNLSESEIKEITQQIMYIWEILKYFLCALVPFMISGIYYVQKYELTKNVPPKNFHLKAIAISIIIGAIMANTILVPLTDHFYSYYKDVNTLNIIKKDSINKIK